MIAAVVIVLAAGAAPSEAEEISAITAELESKRDWSEEDRTRALAVARLRQDDWGDCLRLAKSRLERSTEPVETVATAILGNCRQEEREYERAVTLSLRGRVDAAQRIDAARDIVARAKADARETLVAQLVAARLP